MGRLRILDLSPYAPIDTLAFGMPTLPIMRVRLRLKLDMEAENSHKWLSNPLFNT